jgi:hypothetical protein
MDDDLRQELFDPANAHRLVLGHRPPLRSTVACVVSDVVWHEVVTMLRWAIADTGGAPELDSGRWWRLAASCADLLRRLPALSDEVGERWSPAAPPSAPDLDGAARAERVAGRLLALLRSPDPVPLQRLAGEIDALGAAAISALADQAPWALPELP